MSFRWVAKRLKVVQKHIYTCFPPYLKKQKPIFQIHSNSRQLFAAVSARNPDWVLAMLSAGVNVNKAVGPSYLDTLIVATRYDQLEIAKLLIAADVDLDFRDESYGSTALMVLPSLNTKLGTLDFLYANFHN